MTDQEETTSEGTGTPNVGTEVPVGETGTLTVDDPSLPEAPALEDQTAKPISASWGGIKVVFRARRIEVFNAGEPTVPQLEDAIRTGLEAVYGDDFAITVFAAERTDR